MTLQKNTLTVVTGRFHIPSGPIPVSFRYPSVMGGEVHACGTNCDEVLVANLVTLPPPFHPPSVILPLCR